MNTQYRKKALRYMTPVFLCWTGILLADDSVVNSKHDLSAQGPGPIRSVNEDRVCIFCHTPHNAAPQTPLWNRANPQTYYRIYESSTTDARIDQPSGSSKMCLSCHDGSMALGNVLSRPATHPIVMTQRTIPPGSTDLTNDLSDDHPIGFRYDRALSNADRQIRDPEVVSMDLPLGAHGEVHCSTCHDPHDNELGDFLRVSDQMGAVCISCHDLDGWHHSSHALSNKRTPGRQVDPLERLKYATVADNSCMSCHKIHGAPHRERLLRAKEESDNCLNCHNGSIAAQNIASQIGKRSAHWLPFGKGAHDPAESPFAMRRHVECVDCHNPHASRPGTMVLSRGSSTPALGGPNQHVKGITASGRETDNSRFLYEICFKCHADGVIPNNDAIIRQVYETNTRLEFRTTNQSFHPVVGPRRNSDVVSLISPMRPGSMITCIDCHNSNDAPANGGTGPNGPHGSLFEPLLVRNYETLDYTPESEAAYSLCYGCHSRTSILNDESFSLHRRHIVELRTPCSVCHDAHGVGRSPGGDSDHTSLINFDLSVVSPANSPNGRRISFEDTGTFSGNCTLTCHGFAHIGFPYANNARAKILGTSSGPFLGAGR